MNERFDMRFFNRFLKFGGTLLLAGFLVWVIQAVGGLNLAGKVLIGLIPVVLAFAIAYLLEPPIKGLSRYLPRQMAVIIVYILLTALLAGLLWLLIPALLSQLERFFQNLPALISQINWRLAALEARIGFKTKLEGVIDQLLSDFAISILNNISNIFSIIMIIIMALVGALFLSFDFLHVKQGMNKWLSQPAVAPGTDILRQVLPSAHRYAVGLLIDNAIMFLLAAVVFYLARAEYPFLLALIVALTNFIPLIGQFIGGVPIVLLGFGISFQQGITYLIIVVVLQLFESNVIQPLMLKSALKIKPIENLAGVAVFGQLFGIVGMVLSPFLVLIIKISCAKYFTRNKIGAIIPEVPAQTGVKNPGTN